MRKLFVLAAIAALLLAQETPKPGDFAAYMKAGQPGPHHRVLDALAGEWDLAVRFRMAPEAGWAAAKSRGSAEWILGGRFLRHDVTGAGGFAGLGLIGYENLHRRYVYSWMESYSTSMVVARGTADESGKVITLRCEAFNLLLGRAAPLRIVLEIESAEKHVLSWYMLDAEGNEFQTHQITYTRRE